MSSDQPRKLKLQPVAIAVGWLAVVVAMTASLSPPWAPSLVLAVLCVSALALHIFDRRQLALVFAGAGVLAAGYWLISLGGVAR